MPQTNLYTFTLKGISPRVLDEEYGLVKPDEPHISSSPQKTQITPISQPHPSFTPIHSEKISEFSMPVTPAPSVTFLDEAKAIRQCVVMAWDYESFEREPIDCYWCSHNFQPYLPIGCPISYISNQAIKKYVSEITKDTYTIKEDITPRKLKLLLERDDKRIHVLDKGYYDCDGVFCSENCCQAFINSNKHNPLYENSTSLLLQMHRDIYKDKISCIKPAGNWRLLRKFGGILDINTFRENFNKVEYTYHGIIRKLVHPVETMWEDRICF